MTAVTDPHTARRRPRTARGRLMAGAAGILVVAAAGVGLYLFEPWTLLTSTTVNEAAPTVPDQQAAPLPAAGGTGDQVAPEPAAGPGAPSAQQAGPLSGPGMFLSLAHRTSGKAVVLRTTDGSAVLRITDLSTSDGPDVRVWLSSAKADRAADAEQGTWLELGPLKGNKGNQNYAVPAGTDLSRFSSVVLWCKRFSVAFGAAALSPA